MWPIDSYPELREVLLTTKTGRTFKGVLWRRRGGYLVLRNACLLREREAPLALDGEVVVERSNVDWLQVPR